MSKHNYPYIAFGLGLFLMLIVMKGSEMRAGGVTAIPLFTLLAISEFAFFVTAIGAYVGIKQILTAGITPFYTIVAIGCIPLSIGFVLLGIELWPQ